MGLKSKLFRNVKELEAAAVSNPAHIVPGAIGGHVALIQQALVALDGACIAATELETERYGPSTAQAVLNYKKMRRIINFTYQQTADNIVGKMTMEALDQGMARLEQTIRTHRN